MSAVCTIGYEGATLDQWVETLSAAGVDYVHIRALGTPRDLRHALKDREITSEQFAPVFREQLSARGSDIARVLELAESQCVCLVCFEADPATCHRSLVAASLVAAAPQPLSVEYLSHACRT